MTPEEFARTFDRIRQEVRGVIVGHQELIDHVLIALLAGGQALLEGVPGLGKTRLVKTLPQSLDLGCSRIRLTPDRIPAAIIGTNAAMPCASGRPHSPGQRRPAGA